MLDLAKRNEEIGRRWYEEMWSQPAPELAETLVSPSYKPAWVSIDAAGPAQILHEIGYFRSAFPDLRYQIVAIKGEAERVWIRYRAEATHAGPAWGFPATGKPVTFEGATILDIDEAGQVVDRWGAFCFYDILVDLSLAPPLWDLAERLAASEVDDQVADGSAEDVDPAARNSSS